MLSWFFPPSLASTGQCCSLSVEDACAIADTGDILLVSGTSPSSIFVEMFTVSQWSHIGVVYRSTDKSPPAIFESIKHDDDSGENVDLIKGDLRVGVRLIDMHTFLKNFVGNAVALRCIVTPRRLRWLEPALYTHLHDTLTSIINIYHGRPYEHRLSDFLISRLFPESEAGETFDSFFCSELVAFCYIKFGLIDYRHVCATQFLPDAFSKTGAISSSLTYPRALRPPDLLHLHSSAGLIRLTSELYIKVGRSAHDDDDSDGDNEPTTPPSRQRLRFSLFGEADGEDEDDDVYV